MTTKLMSRLHDVRLSPASCNNLQNIQTRCLQVGLTTVPTTRHSAVALVCKVARSNSHACHMRARSARAMVKQVHVICAPTQEVPGDQCIHPDAHHGAGRLSLLTTVRSSVRLNTPTLSSPLTSLHAVGADDMEVIPCMITAAQWGSTSQAARQAVPLAAPTVLTDVPMSLASSLQNVYEPDDREFAFIVEPWLGRLAAAVSPATVALNAMTSLNSKAARTASRNWC